MNKFEDFEICQNVYVSEPKTENSFKGEIIGVNNPLRYIIVESEEGYHCISEDSLNEKLFEVSILK